MSKISRKTWAAGSSGGSTKYDAHQRVLDRTYGAQAGLRRELSDSKAAVAERTEILNSFAECNDPQRAWLLLEDYFEKLSLSRKDFDSQDWWSRVLSAQGKKRLEETAILFLRSSRPLPTELLPHASPARFAEIEQSEREQQLARGLEHWLFPSAPSHLDTPRATLRVVCEARPIEENSALHGLAVSFHIFRQRTGDKVKTLGEVADLTARATHEQELFSFADWEFIQWLSESHADPEGLWNSMVLTGLELLQWLVEWGDKSRLLIGQAGEPLVFRGDLAELKPRLEEVNGDLHFTHHLALPSGRSHGMGEVKFFSGRPALALVGNVFYLLRSAPPDDLLNSWAKQQALPVHKLSRRLLTQLRKTQSANGPAWEQLCEVQKACPRFTFELAEDVVRLRLLAVSESDQSVWHWNSSEWRAEQPPIAASPGSAVVEESNLRRSQTAATSSMAPVRPTILDDPRLDKAVEWLRRLDWFTPEPGLWHGDANENFLSLLAAAWPDRPAGAEYLGNPAFHRLFLAPRRLRPRLVVQGSGIDWFSVSAEWEAEGLKLTPADLQRLQTASGRFIKLPDAGWLELDPASVQSAHEGMADLGVEGLAAIPQRLNLAQAAHLDETGLERFGGAAQASMLRQSLAAFRGIPSTPLPEGICAELRPYQQAGFDFLCHLSRHQLGGILADDMGLGKTLQALAWLAWMRADTGEKKPSLVICPASVLHNWQREASRFTPALEVMAMESGPARHNLRGQIPGFDLIVTNYSLLRRDLEALQKFDFRAVMLDEAQFIKNPDAQSNS